MCKSYYYKNTKYFNELHVKKRRAVIKIKKVNNPQNDALTNSIV